MTEDFNPKNAKVCVFGGGSFGTALAYALSKNAKEVMILTRNESQAETINTVLN